jgi:hypothetical protein
MPIIILPKKKAKITIADLPEVVGTSYVEKEIDGLKYFLMTDQIETNKDGSMYGMMFYSHTKLPLKHRRYEDKSLLQRAKDNNWLSNINNVEIPSEVPPDSTEPLLATLIEIEKEAKLRQYYVGQLSNLNAYFERIGTLTLKLKKLKIGKLIDVLDVPIDENDQYHRISYNSPYRLDYDKAVSFLKWCASVQMHNADKTRSHLH